MVLYLPRLAYSFWSGLVVCGFVLAGCTNTDSGPGRAYGFESGGLANDLVQSTPYPNLHVEVDYVTGTRPDEFNSEHGLGEVTALLQKTGAITVEADTELPQMGEDHAYSMDEVRALEEANRSVFTDEDTASLYVLFLDGHHEDDTDASSILGVAYRGSSLVVFRDTIWRLCEQRTEGLTGEFAHLFCPLAETTVTVHEVGHLMGLVDNGLSMVTDHRDADHGNHDNDPNCIMYYLNNTVDMLDVVRARVEDQDSDEVSAFCDNCLADLAAARGS